MNAKTPKNFSRSDFVSALCGAEAWAISPGWAATLQGWANLENFNPQAIVTQAGKAFGSGLTRTTVSDGVGIMQIRGPLFTHENFMSWLFGFDTYESLATDFQALMNDTTVQGVVMNYHSPGGLVAGGSDFAQMIFDARGLKPKGLVARAGGDMASMAYWLGSSAEKVHTASTGIVGSIGTVVQFRQEDAGVVTVVSDQSPMKRPDLTTEEGMAEVKNLLNSLSSVFISAVARNRGTTPEHVEGNFGKGGVKVGAAAVEAGMADAVSTFDATFSLVKNSTPSTQERTMSQTPASAAAPTQEAPPVAAAPATAPAGVSPDPVLAERARTSDILAAFDGTPFAGEAAGFIRDGKSAQEAQAHVLAKLKANPSAVAPSSAPAGRTVTQTQLATEGSLAASAALPTVPPTGASAGGDDAGALRKAMTAGANGYRNQIAGGNPHGSRFNPHTGK